MPSLAPAPLLPAHLISNARLLPDRTSILPLLPKRKVIAEVGVALGDFSELFISNCEPAHFFAIDLFTLHDLAELWGRPTRELFSGGTHSEFYQKRFEDQIASGRLTLLQGDSAAMLASLEDASLDIVYIDADHGYEAVKRELAAVKTKVRTDGWIILNDYVMTDLAGGNAPYGVIQATNEFMIDEGWEMIYLAFHAYMYCDVVLRKARQVQ